MKKTIVTFTLVFFGILTIKSQSNDNSLLWKISGNGLEAASYVFGTFHLLCPDDLNITEQMKEAVSQSEVLALELDFDDPSLMLGLQSGMIFRDGTTAKDYLDEEEYSLVAEFFSEKMQLPFQQLSVIKPFFLSSMTMLYFLDCQPVSIEMELAGLAKEAEIEVIGLETVEEQLGFIDEISLEDQAKMLVEGIEDLDEMEGMTEQILQTYLAGDLQGINEIMDEYMTEDYSEMNENLILTRNADWIPKIEKLIAEQAAFIAVGAGHLPGDKGILTMLAKAGYKVEAVR